MKQGVIKTLIVMILAMLFWQLGFGHDKQVVGYYPNWQWYRRNQLVKPTTIQYQKYTIINYGFFNPTSSGTIIQTDSWADENILLGPTIWWPVVTHDSTQSLPYLAHQAGVKVLPSIGGWTLSNNFPSIAADPVKRQTFTQSCVSLIQTYNFDGIDLDWEYPGFAEHNGSPADFANFPLLLQQLRCALDTLSIFTGEEYIITSCFGASRERMEDIDWAAVLPLVDMINLMSYDYHGAWDSISNFNSPLYSPAQGDSEMCFAESFEILTQEFNVPPSKINMGLPFYGKALANCTQLYGTHTGYDNATFGLDEGQPHYYTILNAMPSFTYHWDNGVKCPYLLGNSINTFVTYDDTLSIGYKAQYAKDHGAKGVIIWEITGDYLETATGSGIIAGTPLVDKVNAVFSAPDALLPPTNLICVDQGGIVFLNWTPSSDIPETAHNIYRNNIRINTLPIMGTTYQDNGVSVGNTYVYYVTSVDGSNESMPSNPVSVTVGNTSATEATAAKIPVRIAPNPFSERVELTLDLKGACDIRISIYNTKGQRVFDRDHLAYPAGKFSLVWDGKDIAGKTLASGIYLFRITREYKGARQNQNSASKSDLTLKVCLLR